MTIQIEVWCEFNLTSKWHFELIDPRYLFVKLVHF